MHGMEWTNGSMKGMDCQDKGQLGEEGIGGNPKVASRLVTS